MAINSDTIVALDPGTDETAWVIYDGERPMSFGIDPNDAVVELCRDRFGGMPVIYEMVACYGMPVGRDVFETCVWIGRFVEASGGRAKPMYRRDVKHHLCNSAKAKDANVRQALLDRFPRTGGGKTPQVGTKGQPGPLYGVKSHIWSALAIAVTWWATEQAKEGEA